jgi:predicted CoA-binding protein
MKNTLIIGASSNPERYSYLAANRLQAKGHKIFQIGKKPGVVAGEKIEQGKPDFLNIDTVTLYLNPANQKEYYNYILDLKPKRIIFNPGTENPELEELAESKGIETVEACTLVMLSIGNF